MNRSLQQPCRLAPRPSPSGRKEVCGLQPRRVRAGCPGCGEGPGRGTRTWPFLLNRGPLSWQPGCPRYLRGGPGCSRSCVAARGSLFPNPFLPLPSQLSDLVCGLPASGAHSHSLFSVFRRPRPKPLSCTSLCPGVCFLQTPNWHSRPPR